MRSLPLAALLLALGAASVMAGVALAQGPSTPRFDPFDRPSFQGGSAPRGGRVQPGWSPWLKATLVAGERSMVNLGGVLLRLGEETHGYRLVEVREWAAVFMKDAETVVLDVVPPLEVQP
ncbi:MAG: hypothetical protein V3V67_07180 [Myxococcota bacterium]